MDNPNDALNCNSILNERLSAGMPEVTHAFVAQHLPEALVNKLFVGRLHSLGGKEFLVPIGGLVSLLHAYARNLAQHGGEAFGTFVERSDGTTEFRRNGEAHSPTVLSYRTTWLYTHPTPSAAPSPEAVPADPMDWPLPCDVTVGHGTMRKGVALRTLVLRMKSLYEMATGESADEVAGRTLEQRQALAKPLLATPAPPAEPPFEQVVRALSGLLEQVEEFISAHGEADFETGEALAAVEAAVMFEAGAAPPAEPAHAGHCAKQIHQIGSGPCTCGATQPEAAVQAEPDWPDVSPAGLRKMAEVAAPNNAVVFNAAADLIEGLQGGRGREDRMVVIQRKPDGTPSVWCDPEIADLVRALNGGGLPTVASCSGHGFRPGQIDLADGRTLFVTDSAQAKTVSAAFPLDINGTPVTAGASPTPQPDLEHIADVNYRRGEEMGYRMGQRSMQLNAKPEPERVALTPLTDELCKVLLEAQQPVPRITSRDEFLVRNTWRACCEVNNLPAAGKGGA